ncbi:EamA family transporter [Undibacterium oligocarboniphilum]|uniref:4-amino-4-deoxy-L-arabinose transferase n=1 Tax=Undibacterium oligocarboniphilum TaxID=666702 RepID=A0A850QKE3_9BURK|nr:EamA family transporter [Undibacterium oligocarboniphilum]MBC3868656.1 4-amino-4-deoxy-L-arabinose transferase [Undibacterium oligocarboniphilum]NVO76636.1 4-amino-4-deoxy-L-arabinose transferase [Undibacterium oligocarboniphilum]
MNLNTFGFIITGILLNALAQLLLKKGTNAVGAIHLNAENWFHTGVQLATQLPIIGGLSCYVISVVVWIIGLSRVDVSIAYPMLSIGYIVNALGAWYFLGEVMSLQRLLAIGIIIIGVALLVKS